MWKYRAKVFMLALLRLEVLRQEIHHLVNCLVERVFVHDTTLIPTPFAILVPCKPGNCMKAISTKNISTMKCTVVVHK